MLFNPFFQRLIKKMNQITQKKHRQIKRYPKCKFALGNVLIPHEMFSIRTLCEQTLVGGAPSIISIDVNGNREIDGVLQCLQSVMNETWVRQPRLIIVKSRFLYWDLRDVEDKQKLEKLK